MGNQASACTAVDSAWDGDEPPPFWMECGDRFHGFRELTAFPSLALAVSASDKYVPGQAYTPPYAYRLAKLEEVKCMMGDLVSEHTDDVYYAGRGGWSATTFGGVSRSYFLFADSADPEDGIGGYISAEAREGQINTTRSPAELMDIVKKYNFAGFVCIRKQPVPGWIETGDSFHGFRKLKSKPEWRHIGLAVSRKALSFCRASTVFLYLRQCLSVRFCCLRLQRRRASAGTSRRTRRRTATGWHGSPTSRA
eukprot:SAG22_NODE_179_length_16124_cov_7.355445_4_plen_252_part_00